MKIGIVDDHEDSRYLMRCWLESQNYAVEDWSCGDELIRYLSGNHLHLALVDLWLPDMNGLALPEIVRQRFSRDLPFVAVTAHATKSVRDQALAAGFREYLTKPVDFESLKRVIEGLAPKPI